MTYEEFKNIVRVNQRIVDDDLELTISVTVKKRRRFPIEMCSIANRKELIEHQNNLIFELWTFLQSEIGRTDKELKRAYSEGLRDGYCGFEYRFDINKFTSDIGNGWTGHVLFES